MSLRKGEGGFFKDPWKARDEYITIFLNSTAQAREHFIQRHGLRLLGQEERVEAFQLPGSSAYGPLYVYQLRLVFDDISGLEPVQVLKYAARGMELAQPWVDKDLEAGLMKYLVTAKSNDPDYRDGKEVYDLRGQAHPHRSLPCHGPFMPLPDWPRAFPGQGAFFPKRFVLYLSCV